MLTFFFNHENAVQHLYAPPGQTITEEYYTEILRWLRDGVRRKRPELWANGDWHLHHDNAPTNLTAPLQAFLAKHRITQVCQPPYNPGLAPCNFWLFPQLKLTLKGRRFVNAMIT